MRLSARRLAARLVAARLVPARLLAALLGLVLALTAAGCGGGSSPGSPSPGASGAGPGSEDGTTPKVTVGAFNFNESAILANLYAGALRKAGYEADVRTLGANREVVEPALERGDVGVVPEYVGTLTEFLNKKINGPEARPLASPDPAKTAQALKGLAEMRGLAIGALAPAANQNAFAVTREFASRHSLAKLSDLAGYRGRLVLGGPPECPQRPFCQPGLQRTYGIRFTGFRSLDAGGPLTIQALRQGTIDLGLVFSTNGALAANNLVVLDDDKRLQTADNVVPAVTAKLAKPQLLAALDRVSAVLTTADLLAMNRQADLERKNPQEIARAYLAQKGLG